MLKGTTGKFADLDHMFRRTPLWNAQVQKHTSAAIGRAQGTIGVECACSADHVMAYVAQCVLISFFGAISGGDALMVKDIASTVGDAVFMVHGGISAHRETCLTVENGTP